jgi:hypothetical protein
MRTSLERLVSVAARVRRRTVADTDIKLNLGSTIQDSLEQVGFADITEQQHRVGAAPDLKLLKTHSSSGSLYVEACKPVR